MLKLVNVNKYFNRFKSSEIHVINNTTLELEDTGLIALLGESGSGKTTLLNCIGGLDKIDYGCIYLNGKLMPKKVSYKKDEMRVLNIGYIFQNFYLLNNLSVFDNVALSLQTIGIKNKKEIKEKVDYVLTKVGMYRYRNKPAGMLSGGERQRVAIARAIVKNPEIIIADEPTGNLDSKNTLEIMNIISAIAKEKLVILVTHEKKLAEFYATRIISIEDGEVKKDYINDKVDDLDYRIDNIFYLKDFKHHQEINDKKNKLDIYSDENRKLKLSIVIKGDNIYIKSAGNENIEIAYEDSNIEFVDDHYKKIEKKEADKYDFDIEKLSNKRVKYSSIYSLISMIKSGYNTVKKYKLVKKILLIGFFITAMFIVYSMSAIFGSTKIEDKDFIVYNPNYIKVKNVANNIDEYSKLKKNTNIEYVIPGTSTIHMALKNNIIYQFHDAQINLSASLVSSKKLNSVVIGRIPQSKYEIVVDKMVYDRAVTYASIKTLNYLSASDLISAKITIDGLSEFTIVGISDNNSPSIYFSEEMMEDVIARGYDEVHYETTYILSTNAIDEDVHLIEGKLPTNDYEVMVNIADKEFMPLGKEIDYKIDNRKLKVVGYYKSYDLRDIYYVNTNTLSYENALKYPSMYVYSSNKEKTIEYLNSMKLNASDTYIDSKNIHIEEKKDTVHESLIISSILLGISFIEIYLMVRSSFLSRIKEIGILRAVGMKRIDIYKMFLGEVVIITTLASMPGFILMSLILKEIIKIQYLNTMFVIDARVLILSIVVIYLLNLFIGILPIFNVIRHTPAQILSRNDID